MNVLIVDDSATARVVLSRALRSLGHTCVIAEDGEAAWELFVRTDPAIVISDWLMPGINGDELCRMVRDHPRPSYTYFILLTSLDAHTDVVRGMEAGADDYLKKPFDTEDLHATLISAVRVTALHRRLAGQQSELQALNQKLFDESRHDPLTGVGNRIALRERLEELSASVTRYGHRYCVALYDVDRFKLYNDSEGHLAGDTALRAVAQSLTEGCRSGDTVYRYGGEEFVVVLPEQSLETATTAVERMRADVVALAIAHPALGAGRTITASAGVAALESSDLGDFELALKRADLALYDAKELGRDRVSVSAGGGQAASDKSALAA